MLYTISTLLTQIKEDIGIKDLPMPVDDSDLVRRIQNSALNTFSIYYPELITVFLTYKDVIDESLRTLNGGVLYEIPQKYYQNRTIVGAYYLDTAAVGSVDSTYLPNVTLDGADSILSSVADIQMASALGSMIAHAPTYKFIPPNKVMIYNGWFMGSYLLDIGLSHDISLTTIPPTAMESFKRLATLDIEEYLYNILKRKENLDVGIGNISLKIDSWENASEQKRDLLERWEEDSSLNLDGISYF
jgi:hypothetical protein